MDNRDWLNIAEATEPRNDDTEAELERVLRETLATDADAIWLWEMRNLSLTANAFDL